MIYASLLSNVQHTAQTVLPDHYEMLNLSPVSTCDRSLMAWFGQLGRLIRLYFNR